MRIASYHTGLSARGPGLILRDILRLDEVPAATVEVMLAADADVIALQDFDYDATGAALGALADALRDRGLDYPYELVLRPNSGRPTGIDLDGDGRRDGPRDAHGYGRFSGDGGMALLSRYPLGAVRDFTDFLWQDLPENSASGVTPAEALPVLRLHGVAAWDVEVLAPSGPFNILTSHASAPVFDGPEDRNGLRNADELRFWQLYLEGWPVDGSPFRGRDFALMGTFNIDPDRGEGRREVLVRLLEHPLLQDPTPESGYGSATADWDDPTPGDLRVDYVLPSRSLIVRDAGVIWPESGPLSDAVVQASDHRLVWVDVEF